MPRTATCGRMSPHQLRISDFPLERRRMARPDVDETQPLLALPSGFENEGAAANTSQSLPRRNWQWCLTPRRTTGSWRANFRRFTPANLQLPEAARRSKSYRLGSVCPSRVEQRTEQSPAKLSHFRAFRRSVQVPPALSDWISPVRIVTVLRLQTSAAAITWHGRLLTAAAGVERHGVSPDSGDDQ